MYGTNEKNRKSICIRKKLTGKVYAFKDKINESLCFTTHSWILYKLYAHLVFFSYSHLFFLPNLLNHCKLANAHKIVA
jgi:hypothetical protein